jgi:endo-1,4-beta-xylanase
MSHHRLPWSPTRRAAVAGVAALSMGGPAWAQGERSLAAAARRSGRLYGAAAEPGPLESDREFAALFRRQCAVLTAENALKWNALRPSIDRYDFADADRLVDFTRRYGLRLHGHGLVWHEALPAWFAGAADASNARRLLGEHIRTVVGRYAGSIGSWDVVNEAVERNDRRPDGLRRSPWLELAGADYLDFAFRTAHEADPSAVLTLSDYGLEYDDVSWMVEKRGTMLELLAGMKARGIPIHALALQGHLDGGRPPAFGRGLSDFLRDVAALGLKIFITELDVSDQTIEGDVAERDAIVASVYRAFLATVLREPAVRVVVTWGLSDRYTSQSSFRPRADGSPVRPLPFDRSLAAKPAAMAMLEAFDRAPG